MPVPSAEIRNGLPARTRLILADDHQMFVEAVASYLSRDFDIVATVGDGDALLKLLRLDLPDCLLLDIALPGRNGLELIPSALTLRPTLKVLVVTMFLDRLLADAAFAAGANGFVPKDASADELTLAVGEVASGRRYISPRVPTISHHVALNAAHRALHGLTPRQQEIVVLLGEGRSQTDVARVLGVGLTTVIFHKHKIMQKLGLTTNASLRQLSVLVRTEIQKPPVV
jgi:DNA-binding NarL/FixJ family response regulator